MATRRWLLIAASVTGVLLCPLQGLVTDAVRGDEIDEIEHEEVEKRPRGEVRSDKALVYYVRPTHGGFKSMTLFRFFCDNDLVGLGHGRSYAFAHVEPDKHIFWSKGENVDAMQVEVLPGKTYYFLLKARTGLFDARVQMRLLDEADGQAALEECFNFRPLTEKMKRKGTKIAKRSQRKIQKALKRRANAAIYEAFRERQESN